MALLMKSAVSQLIPKLPSASPFATSSEVRPNSAISASWMTVAPCVASAVMMPRFIQSIISGVIPVLTTCPPTITTTAFLAFAAAAITPANSRNSFAARILGREEANSVKLPPGLVNLANASVSTFRFISAIRNVFSLAKSASENRDRLFTIRVCYSSHFSFFIFHSSFYSSPLLYPTNFAHTRPK